MVTQTIEFSGPQEQTINVKLYLLGDDTIIAQSNATERIGKESIYTVQFNDLAINTYRLIGYLTDGTAVASWWVDIENIDGIYPAYEMPQSAIINGVNQIIEELEQSNQIIVSSIQQSNQIVLNGIQQSNEDIKQYIDKLTAAKDRIILGKCKDKSVVKICKN